MQLLQNHDWPGNIRELENLIKRFVILGSEDSISADLLSREHTHFRPETGADGSVSLKAATRQAVRDVERKMILKVLQANHWNRKQTARALSISYRALLYKIKEAGLPAKKGSRTKNQGNSSGRDTSGQ